MVVIVVGGVIYWQSQGLTKIFQNKTSLISQSSSTSLPEQKQIQYRLDYAEGDCNQDQDCQWVGEGCGGGHGNCTNQPEKYKPISTCEMNIDFPSNQGYSCSCIQNISRCGWIK